ncbi:MAG: cob(I)yrinic acid a,c-diamide adenosyltransferase [Myxococcota bacterium]|nr:cob(I)yrinic acid a,c-diamide adenosyltransferase [Myxococcota bacterium]
MKLYTKTGDDGTTGLFGGGRVQKCSARVEAYGTVDETNAAIGAARAAGLDREMDGVLACVQEELFALGAELASAPGRESKLAMALLGEAEIVALEHAIDAADAACPPLDSFVLPGGSQQAASLHVARTVCRRAERAVVALEDRPARRELIVYLNRLSDLLFALARQANRIAGVLDVPWKPRA